MPTIVCTPHHSRVLSARAARRASRLASEQTYCETVVTLALKALFLGWVGKTPVKSSTYPT